MLRDVPLLSLAVLLAACTPAPVEKTPVPLTPPAEATAAPVVRRAIPEPAVAPTPPQAKAPAQPIAIPPGAIYACVAETGGERGNERTVTAIEFAPKVGALCAKNPEMGPCQYERNICRRAGGRVYAANGDEITMKTEAEYDKKVMRVQLKSN